MFLLDLCSKIIYILGGFDTCKFDDFACLAMAHSDRLGLESIKSLHRQLDDDKDGNIDLSESDDVSSTKVVLVYSMVSLKIFNLIEFFTKLW